jgi:tRNA A-37 threonylcarbamoyl transferase component Bud32
MLSGTTQNEFVTQRFGGLKWRARLSCLSSNLRTILVDPDSFLNFRATIMTSDDRSTVGQADGYVLKRTNFTKVRHCLKELFVPSRARREFLNAYQLERSNIPTPRPVATSDRRRLGVIVRSYVVTEALPGAINLTQWAILHEDRQMITRVAELVAKLHNQGLLHGDLAARNIIVDSIGNPWLIDLEALRCFKKISEQSALLDLAKLALTVRGLRSVSRSQRMRFLKSYCAHRGCGDARWWWNNIERRYYHLLERIRVKART